MALNAIEHEIDAHLAREEAAEARAEAVDQWFAGLPDSRRAELLWDFIERTTKTAAWVRIGERAELQSVRIDLSAELAIFLDEVESRGLA